MRLKILIKLSQIAFINIFCGSKLLLVLLTVVELLCSYMSFICKHIYSFLHLYMYVRNYTVMFILYTSSYIREKGAIYVKGNDD